MSWGKKYFSTSTTSNEDREREELREICRKRDEDPNCRMKTVITEKEMQTRKKLGLPCEKFQTLEEFQRKAGYQAYVEREKNKNRSNG